MKRTQRHRMLIVSLGLLVLALLAVVPAGRVHSQRVAHAKNVPDNHVAEDVHQFNPSENQAATSLLSQRPPEPGGRPWLVNPAPNITPSDIYGNVNNCHSDSGCFGVSLNQAYAVDFPDEFDVKAAHSGELYIVTQAGDPNCPANGTALIAVINYGNGWRSVYAHLAYAKHGDTRYTREDAPRHLGKVDQGTVIGRSGNTGACSKHLHFELRYGDSENAITSNGYSYPFAELGDEFEPECGHYEVGQGSSRQALFQTALDRTRDRYPLGCPVTRANWWPSQSDPNRVVLQYFQDNAAIIHDERHDSPQGSVPAYVVRGAIWAKYKELGGPTSSIGPPTSDEFNRGPNDPQSSFKNGYIRKEAPEASFQFFHWPIMPSPPTSDWKVEYFNFEVDDFDPDRDNRVFYPTFIGTETQISHDWGTGSPSNLGVLPDHYSAKWSKTIYVDSLLGTFLHVKTVSDDSVRVKVNGKTIIDEWAPHPRTEHAKRWHWLGSGRHTLEMEYREVTGRAVASLEYCLSLIGCAFAGEPIETPIPTSTPPPPPPTPEQVCPQSGGLILYKHWQYDCGGEVEGRGFVRRDRAGWQNIPSEFNDQASSLRVPTGWSVKLYEHVDRGGGWVCRNSSDDNFGGDTFNNGVPLNDQVSSFEVFELPDCGQPANSPPHTPSPQSPNDGYETSDGLAPTLCWNNPGDPDGDQLKFYAEIYDSPVNIGSGWVGDTCWRPSQLDGQFHTYQWHVKARDSKGVESGWSGARHFTIASPSNEPPTISFDTANGDGFPSHRIWSRERNWAFQGTASDPEGRLDRIEFRCSGDNCGSQTRHDGLSNWQHDQADMAGRNDIYFVAVDDEHSTASRHLELDIDLAAPVTAFSLNNETKANLADWSNRWFTGPVQVRLQATDQGTDRARSGVQEIRYRLDGGSWQTSSGNSVAFTVSTDGTHTVEYYAVDQVGNAESTHSATFKIDQTPPSPPSGAGETHGVVSDQWQNDYNTPTFTWAASNDAASGVWGYQFYFGPEPDGVAYQTFLASQSREWTPKSGGVRTGTYYLRGRTRDNAGNWSNWVSLFTFRYDGTPPENPKEAAHAGGVAHDTWQNTTNLADFTWPKPHDEGSGIQGYRVYWGSNSAGTSSDQIQSESFQSTTPLCDANAACTGYLRLRSVDSVDNLAEEWSTVFVLRYDNAPPVVDDFNINGTVTHTTQTLVTLNITASDEGSGVREMMVSNHSDFEDAQWEVYAEERLWTVPAISRQWWPVYVKVRDGVGLPSEVISDTIYLDVNPKQPRSASFRLFDHALSAGAGVYTGTTSTGEVAYTGRGTVGQVIGHNTGQAADAAQLSSPNYLITGGYEAGSQARPIEEPGHDEFTFINGVFASGTGAETLQSPLYQMLGSAGEVALPNNETTLNSNGFQHQPGFLAAKPPRTPAPTSTPPPGPTPTPEPTPAFAQINVNDGAPFTSDLNVTLSITAPLATDMKLSNDETFAGAEWEPYTATKAWTLAAEGQQVMPRFVYAKFRDSEGTEHGVYFDDIIYDPNAPDGALSPNESMVDEDASLSEASANSESARLLADEVSAGSQVQYVQRLGDQELAQPMALLSTNDDGSVNLYVNAQDDNSGLTEMQVGTSSTFDDAAWEPQSALKPWVPEGGDGIKTVYARFRDNAGNVSEPAQTSFILDTLPPFGAIAIDERVVGPDVLDVPLRLAAVDNLSGVADMRISQDPDFNAAVWQPYATSATWPISLTAQSEGALYVQYRDLEGNVSAVYSDTYRIDTTPPELYVEVSSGDTFTRTLTILAYDELADVTTLYLSNDPLMIEDVVEQPYSETVEWTFDERGVVWVQAKDSVGNISEPLPAVAVFPAMSLPLQAGWNLASFRLEPLLPAVNQALSNINNQYDRVLAETGVYDTNLDDVYNTLQELHSGEGYYLHITDNAGANLSMKGLSVPGDSPLDLHRGWNWIGYLPDSPMPIAQALQSIDGLYQRVLSLDKAYDPDLPEYSNLTELRPGEGYLIYMDQAATLTYPAGGAGVQGSMSAEEPGGRGVEVQGSQGAGGQGSRGAAVRGSGGAGGHFASTCAGLQPTPFATLVYGSLLLDGQPAPTGTRIEVVTPKGDVAGCFVIEKPGQYGLMHVYGADPTAQPPIPGFEKGELLRFRVNGVEAAPREPLTWQDDRTPHRVDLSVAMAWPYRVFPPAIERGGH